MKTLVLVCMMGAAMCYPAGTGRSASRSAPQIPGPSIRDHQLSASTYTSHEDDPYYDDESDEADDYHGEEDSSEFDPEGTTTYSNDKTHDSDNKWNGPLALPPGYHQNGSPHPVQDLPEVVAERQKHLHLYSFGPHAGTVAAAQNGQKPVPGGFSSPWVPIIVPVANHYQPIQQLHPLQF